MGRKRNKLGQTFWMLRQADFRPSWGHRVGQICGGMGIATVGSTIGGAGRLER